METICSKNHPWYLPPTSNLSKNPVGSFLKNTTRIQPFITCYLSHGLLNSLFLCLFSIFPFILNTEVKVTETSNQNPPKSSHLTQNKKGFKMALHNWVFITPLTSSFITIPFIHLAPAVQWLPCCSSNVSRNLNFWTFTLAAPSLPPDIYVSLTSLKSIFNVIRGLP